MTALSIVRATVRSTVQRRFNQFERFDQLMFAVAIALIMAIGGVILAGDRAGVGVTLIDPATALDSGIMSTLHSTMPLRLRFSDPMDIKSVHLTITPPIDGLISWTDAQLTLTPARALIPGQTYQVALDNGATARNGRVVKQIAHWQIQVAPLQIVYLAPAMRARSSVPTNLWLVAPPNAPIQLTHSLYSIDDFAPSPDGTKIAFSQRDKSGKTDLYLLTVATAEVRQITRCVNAPCRAPAWNPDGTRLVYERADSTRADSDVRSWLLDLSTLQTAPLIADSQWLGKAPHWSPDGKTISLYDHNAGGIFLIDVASGQRSFLQTLEDTSGQFAPGNRQQLVYQQLIMAPQGALRQLSVADFADKAAYTIHPLTPPDGALTDDSAASWNPDGAHLIVMRRYLDDRETQYAQAYQIDVVTGEAQPIVVDPQYAHGALSWSPDGGRLLMQRYPFMQPDGQTGIWIYAAQSKTLIQVAQNGFFPQWLP